MIEHMFVCDSCKMAVSDTDTAGIHRCPRCGKDMRWSLNIGIHGNYRNPVHSDSLAISPDQRKEHEILFPNIRIDGENRPIFDNYVDHEAYLNKCGIIKNRQKIRPKGKKIEVS